MSNFTRMIVNARLRFVDRIYVLIIAWIWFAGRKKRPHNWRALQVPARALNR